MDLLHCSDVCLKVAPNDFCTAKQPNSVSKSNVVSPKSVFYYLEQIKWWGFFFSVLDFLVKSIFIHVENMERVWILFAFYISHGWPIDNSTAHFTATSSSRPTSSILRYNVLPVWAPNVVFFLELLCKFLVMRLDQNWGCQRLYLRLTERTSRNGPLQRAHQVP